MLKRIVHSGLRLCLTSLVAGGLASIIVPAAALAEPADYCRQLEAQFGALGAGSRTNPQQIARYDNAIASQLGELRKAEDQIRQAGCGATRAPVCTGLEATVQRMRQNLADLQHTRQRLATSAGLEAERTRLSAAMSAEGCSVAASAEASPEPDRPSNTAGAAGNMSRVASAENGTHYRTLCVRMCDGFFFPISHSTPRSMFERDERLCSARCPGTQVQLHFHRFPAQESEEMISVPTGRPYREAENAFRYRQASWERPANCGCAPERGFDVVAGGAGWTTLGADEGDSGSQERMATASTQQSGSFLIQEERAPPAEPAMETGAASAEAPAIDATMTASEGREQAPAVDRPVRVVGPTFLPAPEEAIDLRSQDPYRAR